MFLCYLDLVCSFVCPIISERVKIEEVMSWQKGKLAFTMYCISSCSKIVGSLLGHSLSNWKNNICTASGTRSVIEVLFVSFEKFLLQFLSCLAAQQLEHAPTAYGTFRINFDKTLPLT